MFEPLRNRLGGNETWLGYLVSCPYCASHWVAFALVPLTRLYGIQVQVRWGVLRTVLDWSVDESQGLVRRRNKVIEQVADEEETGTHLRH